MEGCRGDGTLKGDGWVELANFQPPQGKVECEGDEGDRSEDVRGGGEGGGEVSISWQWRQEGRGGIGAECVRGGGMWWDWAWLMGLTKTGAVSGRRRRGGKCEGERAGDGLERGRRGGGGKERGGEPNWSLLF